MKSRRTVSSGWWTATREKSTLTHILVLGPGIVAYDTGILVSTASTGALYYFDLTTVDSTLSAQEVLPPSTIPNADGLELYQEPDGGPLFLYIAQSVSEKVSVYLMQAGVATWVGDLATENLDGPTSSVVVGDYLYVVNARLSLAPPYGKEIQPANFDLMFTVVGVNRILELPTGPEPTQSPVESSTVALGWGWTVAMLTALFWI